MFYNIQVKLLKLIIISDILKKIENSMGLHIISKADPHFEIKTIIVFVLLKWQVKDNTSVE